MNPHEEVEIKFRADDMDVAKLHKFIANHSAQYSNEEPKVSIKSYCKIAGWDHFWKIGDKIIRYREGEDGESELTYKARKSKSSITDRVEINVPLRSKTYPETVEAFLTSIGADEELCLHKTSHIYWLEGTIPGNNGQYNATVAWYTVSSIDDPSYSESSFLEVEIESNSNCDIKGAHAVLENWSKWIQKELGLGKPINKSLYEIYSKKR